MLIWSHGTSELPFYGDSEAEAKVEAVVMGLLEHIYAALIHPCVSVLLFCCEGIQDERLPLPPRSLCSRLQWGCIAVFQTVPDL